MASPSDVKECGSSEDVNKTTRSEDELELGKSIVSETSEEDGGSDEDCLNVIAEMLAKETQLGCEASCSGAEQIVPAKTTREERVEDKVRVNHATKLKEMMPRRRGRESWEYAPLLVYFRKNIMEPSDIMHPTELYRAEAPPPPTPDSQEAQATDAGGSDKENEDVGAAAGPSRRVRKVKERRARKDDDEPDSSKPFPKGLRM